MLIKSEIINPNISKQNSKNHFTIERYLSGNFFDYVPDSRAKIIPRYMLPTNEEIESLSQNIDSNIENFFDNCDEDFCKTCRILNKLINTKENNLTNYKSFHSPTRPADIDCDNLSFLDVHNFKGNVSEWTATNSTIYGSSWQDAVVNYGLTFKTAIKKSAANIGFRNICRLEKN